MIPTVNGNVHQFRVVGLYNGLAIVADDETQTYWDHMTGEAFHGKHRGEMLTFWKPLEYMTANQVLANYPNAETAQQVNLQMRLFSPLGRRILSEKGQLIPPFFKSMAREDERRPRLEMGVGLWSAKKQATFYPMQTIKAQGYLFTELDGQRVLLYVDPVSKSPDAIYTHAQFAQWDDGKLILDDGCVIHNKLVLLDGMRQSVERPRYLLTRWYGFALTFPKCNIFEVSLAE